MKAETVFHALERTSPKGGPFVGTCWLCGTPNLKANAACEPCPNHRGMSNAQAIIAAVQGNLADMTKRNNQ